MSEKKKRSSLDPTRPFGKQLRYELIIWVALTVLSAISFLVILQSDNFNCTDIVPYCNPLTTAEQTTLTAAVSAYVLAVGVMPLLVIATWLLQLRAERTQSAQKTVEMKKPATRKTAHTEKEATRKKSATKKPKKKTTKKTAKKAS